MHAFQIHNWMILSMFDRMYNHMMHVRFNMMYTRMLSMSEVIANSVSVHKCRNLVRL